jgi:putative DNA primase/helicase
MPPSKYPSGGIYEFVSDQAIGEIEVAEFPQELLDHINGKEDNLSEPFVLPDKIHDGQRNDMLFRYASQLRATGMEKNEIMPAVYTINAERCEPPYDQEKLEIIVTSACKYKKGRKPIPQDEIIYSDIYNAKVFHEIMGEKIRWCKDLGGWFMFDGTRWDKDSNDTIKKYALVVCEEIGERMRKIGRIATPNLRKIHTDQGINSMISCSKALFGCAVDDFDKDKQLFNCLNGTYNLNLNIFEEHNPTDLLTKRANVIHDIHADAPRWKTFLDEIFLGNVELIGYVQRAIGYSMTAMTKEHCMFILYGHGRNGKNIFT